MCERLPEHPREQDCVTLPLPSVFRLRPFQPGLPVVSSQLPEEPQIPPLRPPRRDPVGMTDLRCSGRHDKAKSERRKSEQRHL